MTKSFIGINFFNLPRIPIYKESSIVTPIAQKGKLRNREVGPLSSRNG